VSNEQKIWDSLKSRGLNDFAVAGIMGNLLAESGLRADNLQNSYEKKLGMSDAEYTAAVDSGSYDNFVNDKAGYGLAQWTYYSRKQALLNYCKAYGSSIGDLDMQLGFLWQELQGYSGVMKVLKNAKSVREASDAILLQYERPADTSELVQIKRATYGGAFYDEYAEKKESEAKTMKNIEFVEKLKDIAVNYKTLYVMGCFGAPMTDANKQRYCNNHDYNKQAARTAMIKAASADTFGFDCVCLIKGVLWGWNGNTSAAYGGATYASNGVPDIGADAMIEKCSGVSTDFSNIEVGEAVWLKGHIGVYIGNGLAVECSPAFANKVQITAVKNIGDKAGYSGRAWTKHGKLPYITYEAGAQPAEPTPAPASKSVNEVAREVIKGSWGNGAERKQRLEAAGYNYGEVQARVDELCKQSEQPKPALKSTEEVAKEVLSGSWGNGAERKQRLEAAGYNYGEVQEKVNQLCSQNTTPAKSVDEVAREVIKGSWGNGAERKQRLEAAGYNYGEVQARVNELCK
jgi:hypothetical protein